MNDAPRPHGLATPQRYWAVLGVWLALTAAALDGAMISVALPTLARDLHATPAQSIWVLNSFQLAVVVSLLPLAALGERIAYRRVFLAGLTIFVAASALCVRAHSLSELAVARALQGFGAGGLMSTNGALVRYIYPARQVGQGIGLNAMIIAVVGAVGPGVAAVILSWGDWRWLFAPHIAFGLAALLVGFLAFPWSPGSGRRLDMPSVALNVAAFGLFVAGAEALLRGERSLLALSLMTGGVAAGAGMIARSLSQAHPLFPLDLLRRPIMSLSAATSTGAFAAQMLAFVVLPFFFDAELGASALDMGVYFMAWSIAIAVIAPVAGWLADRWPVAALGGVGLVCLATGLALLAQLPADASGAQVAWRMVVCGAGFGLFQAPNNRALLSSAPLGRAGAAAGVQATARISGQILGALAAAFFLAAAVPARRAALAAGAMLALFAALVSVARFRRSAEAPR